MVLFISIFLIAVAVILCGLNIYFVFKVKKQNVESCKKLNEFTKRQGTSNKGVSLDEVKELTFYSPKDLGIY